MRLREHSLVCFPQEAQVVITMLLEWSSVDGERGVDCGEPLFQVSSHISCCSCSSSSSCVCVCYYFPLQGDSPVPRGGQRCCTAARSTRPHALQAPSAAHHALPVSPAMPAPPPAAPRVPFPFPRFTRPLSKLITRFELGTRQGLTFFLTVYPQVIHF
jgi:hypothetical protein